MVNHLYRDILERIPTQPLWWDEHAVPRYCEFSPEQIAYYYAREAVLLLITTQNGPFVRFRAAVSRPHERGDLADSIRCQTIAYRAELGRWRFASTAGLFPP
jgi:hypothetical protein